MSETMEAAPAVARARAPEDRLARAARFAPSTFDAAARTVEVVFTTGADVPRRDWWTGESFVERLRVTPEAVDLSRLNAGAPVLDTHQSWELQNVIGVVERAWIADGEGRALIRFSDRPEVQPIIADVRSGIIRNISAGYWVQEWQVTEATATSAKIKEATRWMPGELSLVPVPADAGAQMRGAQPNPNPNRGPAPHNPETRMSESTTPDAPAPETAPAATPPAPAQRQAPAAATLAEIEGIAQRAGLGADWTLAQLRTGATLDQVRDAAIDAGAALRAAPVRPAAQVTRDEGETARAAAEGWLLHRMAPAQHALQGPAEAARGMSLLDLARESLERAGVRTRGMIPSEVARAALGLPGQRAGATPSDFPVLLSNVQQKRLLSAYGVNPRNFDRWARRRDLPDFKITQVAELGIAPALKQITAQGNIEYGLMGEAGEQWQLARYARNVALSYVAIANDDLSGFQSIPTGFATAAANLENALVYSILGANPVMSDGVALFSASRSVAYTDPATGLPATAAASNTTSGALSVDNWSALRTLIIRQRDASGQQNMVMPTVLIVPTELEAAALALFSGIIVPTAPTTAGVNPWRGSVEVVPSQFLTDPNDWFGSVAAGSGVEPVEYGYELGAGGPQLTSYTDPDVDGMVFSCRHSFGAKAVTWRTIARSAN